VEPYGKKKVRRKLRQGKDGGKKDQLFNGNLERRKEKGLRRGGESHSVPVGKKKALTPARNGFFFDETGTERRGPVDSRGGNIIHPVCEERSMLGKW